MFPVVLEKHERDFPWLSYNDALSIAGFQTLNDRRQGLTK
jgi:hypothetical protein